jgi:hypothetical protein
MSKSEFDNNETLDKFSKGLETKTNAEVANELAALELEEKRLDLEIKREQVAKIKAKRAALLEEAQAKLQAVRSFLAQREANWANCNHRKGGIGAAAVVNGQGTDSMYTVAKHKKPNGRWMVLCNRCGKEWHQGYPLLGEEETPGFREAIQYPTDNSPSGSSTFLFERTAAAA